MQNGVIESFNGRFRDECLNANRFRNLCRARLVVTAWRNEYNQQPPHGALGYRRAYDGDVAGAGEGATAFCPKTRSDVNVFFRRVASGAPGGGNRRLWTTPDGSRTLTFARSTFARLSISVWMGPRSNDGEPATDAGTVDDFVAGQNTRGHSASTSFNKNAHRCFGIK